MQLSLNKYINIDTLLVMLYVKRPSETVKSFRQNRQKEKRQNQLKSAHGENFIKNFSRKQNIIMLCKKINTDTI